MFGNFEWDPESVPTLKLGFHIAQVVFAFIAFVLEIVVFRDDAALINSNNGWPFGVCFLSIPAWIYLTMAPRFPRTQRLANPHAMATVDGLFTLFWLTAFASQAAYSGKGQCGNACGPSRGVTAMAFFVMLFFGVTLWLSIYCLQYYNWNGRLPGYDKLKIRNHSTDIDPDKAAFSMAPHDEETAYGPLHGDDMDNNGANRRDEATNLTSDNSYAAGGSGTSSMPNPYGPDDYNRLGRQDQHDNVYDDDYMSTGPQQGASGAGPGPIYSPPSASDAYDADRPARFPPGNYS